MSVGRAELGMIANNMIFWLIKSLMLIQIIDVKAKTVLKRKREAGVDLICSDTNIDQIFMSKRYKTDNNSCRKLLSLTIKWRNKDFYFSES